MTNTIKARIVADSINTIGNRLTTFIINYPRIILAELNTHRMLSRNSASSRAIPSKKIVADILANPAGPVFWGANQSGMQAAVELTGPALKRAQELWLEARDKMIEINSEMQQLGLHKQIANRILEFAFVMETIVSATEWENFFALRCHKDAQPEIQALADCMLKEYCASVPVAKQPKDWHLPLMDDLVDDSWTMEMKKKIAVARCARTSYKNFDGKIDPQADIELHDRLAASGHWSPFEHVAMAVSTASRFGNFFGWVQYRQAFPNENRRVDVKELLKRRIDEGSKFAI